MMNPEVWRHYQDYTSDLTGLTRRLGFGAAAVCWFFKGPDGGFPKPVLVSLAFVVAFFSLDVLQALIAALGLKAWIRRREQELWDKTGSIEGDYEKPHTLDRWPFALFLGKILVLFGAFAALGVELWRRIA
jgi:hypothetical protein